MSGNVAKLSNPKTENNSHIARFFEKNREKFVYFLKK